MAEIDHQYTDEVVCPHCGHVHGDSWERGGGRSDDGEALCGDCEKPFTWSRHVSVRYSTEPLPKNSITTKE